MIKGIHNVIKSEKVQKAVNKLLNKKPKRVFRAPYRMK